jgi:hypothetical protein
MISKESLMTFKELLMISNYKHYFIFTLFSLLISGCGSGDGDSARVAQTIDAGVNNIVDIKLDVGVKPNDDYVHAFGKRQYNLTGIDKDNKEINLNSRASWSISNTAVGEINDKGFFQPNGTAGDFILTVKYATLFKEVKIIVTDAALQSVTVSNDATSVDVCKNTTFIGEAMFEGGLVLNFDLTWSFSDTPSTEFAKFKDINSPVMSTFKNGNVNVIAAGKVGTAASVVSSVFPFAINNSLNSIELTSDDSDLKLNSNQTAKLTVKGSYQGATETPEITSNTTFTSSDANALTVDADGKLTAKTGSFAGTPATITATCNGKSQTLNFTVLKTELKSVAIIGPNSDTAIESQSITKGTSLDLRIKATLNDTNGSTEIYAENDVEWAIDKANSEAFNDSEIKIDSLTGVITAENNIVFTNGNIDLTVTLRIKNSNGSTKTNPSGQELKDTIQIVVKP